MTMALYSALRLFLSLLGFLLQLKARRAETNYVNASAVFAEASKKCNPQLVKSTEVALLDQRALLRTLDKREEAEATALKWTNLSDKVQKVRSWFSNTSNVFVGYAVCACDAFTVTYVVVERLLGFSLSDVAKLVMQASGSGGE